VAYYWRSFHLIPKQNLETLGAPDKSASRGRVQPAEYCCGVVGRFRKAMTRAFPGELMVRWRGAATDGRSSGDKLPSPRKKLMLSLNRLSIFLILGALFLSVTTTLHAGRPAQSTNHYSLSDVVSVDLSSGCHRVETGQVRLPAELASYGPPFHFSATLTFYSKDMHVV
jgi:hypothetical protein